VPTAQCAEVVPLKPTQCRSCQHKLIGQDAEPLRHQVVEVPEIKPHITEYQRHRLTCSCCGETTCAELPDGVTESQAGPNLVAFAAVLMGCFKQSKRRVAMFLDQMLGISCSPGWVVKMQQQATLALTPAYKELVKALPQEPVLGGDESPTKQGKSKAWLWVFVASTFTLFASRLTRKAEVLNKLLPNYTGIMICDRAKMYWQCGHLQWCWAHLKRDFQAWADHPEPCIKRFGEKLVEQADLVFAYQRQRRLKEINEDTFKEKMEDVKKIVKDRLIIGKHGDIRAVKGSCAELFNHFEWLWTFVDHVKVEPSNNASERALRPAVIWRKLSFGTQSEAGSRFVETLLTVVETCRQQHRNIFTFVRDSIIAHRKHNKGPSLLPRA
jgi:transposase